MEFFGNMFTHYCYTTTDITQNRSNDVLTISSNKSGFSVHLDERANETIALPAGSPFTDWKEARRFAGPLPFTFTYNKAKREVLIIEGVRENWKPEPVKVLDYNFSFIDNMNLQGTVLANAFVIRNIPYYWKKGKIEPWK